MTLRYSTLTAGLVIWLSSCTVNTVTTSTRPQGSTEESLQQALELNEQAVTYYEQGKYTEAIPLLQKSLATREKVLGKEHPDVATSLNNLAELYRTQGDYARAEPLYQRSLAIREKVLGKEHPAVALSLNNLAGLYQTQGDYARAEPLHQRSLAIREKVLGKEHPEVAQSLNNLAVLYQTQGDYARAEPLCQRSLAIREKVLGKEHPEVATSLNNLAGLYYTQGDYARAEPLYQRSLAIWEKVLGKEHPEVATSLNNLAELYRTQGDYAGAEPLYQRSLAILEKVLAKEHPNVATSLNNLAELYKVQGDYARAEPLHQRALAIKEKVLGKEHPDVALSLNNLAALYHTQGDYARAEPLYQRSLAIREKVLGKEHPDVATSLNNLAELYRTQSDYARAEPLYQRTLNIAEHSSQPELLWHVQSNFSLLLAKQNKPAVAIFFGKKAVNTLQKLRANVTKEFQKSFLKEKIYVYKNLANLLIDQGRLPEAEQVLAMLKQEEYFDFIRRDAQDDPRTTQASFTIFEQPWAERYNAIHTQLVSLGQEIDELKQKKKQHIALTVAEKTRYQRLEQDITVTYQSFDTFLTKLKQAFQQTPTSRAINFAEKDLKDLQALQSTLRDLGHGVVLVTYLMTEDKLRMILTTPEVQLARDAPVTEKQLNQTIEQFRVSLKDHNSLAEDTQKPAKELYDWLIKPIANNLAQAQPKVLMVYLDSTLRYIPLAALYDGTHYLAEKYAVVMYTAAAIDKLKDRFTEHWKVAGLGVTKEFPGFPALRSVEDEFRVIVRLTKEDKVGVIDGVVYLNQDFTAKRLSDLLRKGYPVMHIASHFRFSPTGNDTTSFLLLGDGNKLTLADIKNRYKFPDVDLLTLSACDTAMGNQGTGKEIESFGVLAQRNGAKGVLASLWSVDDTSTAVLMKHLYQLHSTGTTPLNKALALQAAQRVFIEGQDVKRYKHPYYWAPFILMGNWL